MAEDRRVSQGTPTHPIQSLWGAVSSTWFRYARWRSKHLESSPETDLRTDIRRIIWREGRPKAVNVTLAQTSRRQLVCYFNLNASRAIRDVSLERLELPPQSETRDEAILVMAALGAPHGFVHSTIRCRIRRVRTWWRSHGVGLSPENEAKNWPQVCGRSLNSGVGIIVIRPDASVKTFHRPPMWQGGNGKMYVFNVEVTFPIFDFRVTSQRTIPKKGHVFAELSETQILLV